MSVPMERTERCSKLFVEHFRSSGCHVTPVHFYSPIPNTAELADEIWTLKIGGDVNYLVSEVIARLKPGVIVHLHDICLPIEPPRESVVGGRRFWSEQDRLHAFLAFNGAFEVLCAESH
jgi:hypothetical protein